MNSRKLTDTEYEALALITRHFGFTDKAYFTGDDANKVGLFVDIPHVMLDRPVANVIKGCLSEVREIIEAVTGSDEYTLESFLESDWDGSMVGEDEFLKEMIDLVFYSLSVLAKYDPARVNYAFKAVVKKNFERGYYTSTTYDRDNTRGY